VERTGRQPPSGEPPDDAGPAAGSLGPLPTAVGEALARNWKWLLASGILAILAGAVAISVPAVASVFTATFIGWVILFSSVFMLVDAFAPPRTTGRVLLRLLYAGLFVFVGIYLLVAPLEGTLTLTFVLAVWLIALGVMRLAAALGEFHRPGAGLVALNGAASLALGVLIAVELPSSADWAIGLLVGIDFLFYGFTATWTAIAGRELAKAAA
jgi:uncharacterized membrane protein HdeD (DUF308 family)